jgi:Transposase DDE domain
MVSFGSCVQAHHGAICQFAIAHAPPATTISSGGEGWSVGPHHGSLAAAHDAAVQMIDTSIVRVHQHAAWIARNRSQSMGRSRGGLTSKIHAVVDPNGLPVRLALTAGEAHDNRRCLNLGLCAVHSKAAVHTHLI